MKQSGIDWIEEIPDDWKISKAKTILRNKSIKNHPAAEVLSLYRDLGIVPKNSRNDNHNVTSDDTASYKFVQKGELVLNKMKTWQGSLAVSDYEGIVSPAYYVCEFTNQEIDKKYIHYLLRNKMYAQEFERLSTGLRVGQWDLNIDDFLNTPIVYPPKKATQKRIAEYLDSKCAQIDSIIEESKKSIEEYKAWKQSVIFEAVTGKNLNCKKKDSGIEWIGEIPEGWEVKRLKFASRNRIQKYTSDYGILNYFALENIESQSGRFIETENEYDISQSLICKKNDVVFGKLRPYLAKVYKVNELCCCSGEFAVFYDFEGCPSFFKYYFLSDGFIKIINSSTYGTKMPRANIDFIKNMLVAIPPLSEQESIAKMLDSKCAQIDSLIAEKESLIADLTEYKKSLIFEVVTGKRSI